MCGLLLLFFKYFALFKELYDSRAFLFISVAASISNFPVCINPSRMSATYEAGQRQLESCVSELEAFIEDSRQQTINVDSFLSMVRKYTEITELTAEIIRSFVEKVEVYQSEKVPGTRTKKQTICIHWNFTGALDISTENEKTA